MFFEGQVEINFIAKWSGEQFPLQFLLENILCMLSEAQWYAWEQGVFEYFKK